MRELSESTLRKIRRRIFERARRELVRNGRFLPKYTAIWVHANGDIEEKTIDIPPDMMRSRESKNLLASTLKTANLLLDPVAVIFMSEVWNKSVPIDSPEASSRKSIANDPERGESIFAVVELTDGTATGYAAPIHRDRGGVWAEEFQEFGSPPDPNMRFSHFFGRDDTDIQ